MKEQTKLLMIAAKIKMPGRNWAGLLDDEQLMQPLLRCAGARNS